MIGSKFFDYENYRKIKNLNNREIFKKYLTQIFNSLSINTDKDTKIVSKITFSQYFKLPYFISTKIYKIFCNQEVSLTKDIFITEMNKLFNGSLEESIEFTFKLMDFDGDGFIASSDARLILNFLIPNINEIFSVENLILNFFDNDNINFTSYTNRIKNIDSNIYFIIYYYIMLNAPFEEDSLDVINSIYINSLQDCNKTRNKKISFSNIVKPSIKVSNFLSIDIDFLELVEDEDEIMLKEIDNEGLDIIIPKLFPKMISNLENCQYEDCNNNNCQDFVKIFQCSFYLIKKKIKKLKRYNATLVNRDLYIFNENKLIKLYNLTESYIKDDIKKYKYENKYLYSFSIIIRGKVKNLYLRDIRDCYKFINQFKKNLNIKKISDDYVIMNKIGKGSFGEVFIAKTLNSSDSVAIKMFKKNSKNLENIKLEIDILKFCKHENIVNYIDCYEDIHHIYLVEEYIDSPDLYSLIKTKKLKEDEIRDIIRQILNGLNYLHNNGIIHRDLKPQNILIKNHSFVKIIDFNLANILGSGETARDVLGTVYFAAPEVLLMNDYTYKIDIWSLGIVLYYMIYKDVPYRGNNYEVIIGKIMNCKLKLPDISNDLKSFILNCLDINSSKRIEIGDCLNHKWLKNF